MIRFLLGLGCGGTIGFMTACLFEAARENEEDDE